MNWKQKENSSQCSVVLYRVTAASCMHRAVQDDVADSGRKVREM